MHVTTTVIFSVLLEFCFSTQYLIESKINYHFNDTIEDTLVECVIKTIEVNFIHTPTVIMKNILNDKTNKDVFNEKFTKELIRRNIPRIVSQHVDTKSIYIQEGYILIITYIHDCEKLSSFEIGTIKENLQYLFIVLNYTQEICDDILQGFGQNLSVYDVTYILSISEEQIDIITFIPQVNLNTCALEYDVSPTLLSSCSLKAMFNTFPIKHPQNYMGCPLKIGMASLFPFSIIANRSSLKMYDQLRENDVDGSDLKMLKIMAKYFNFTPEYYYIYRFEENPYVNTEFLKFVLNRSLDICAGGLYGIYGDIVDYSGVYGRQAAVWMYAVKRDTRSWRDFIGKVNGLYIFIIFYFLYSFVWKLFCIFDNQTVPIGRILLHTWGTLIGTSSVDEGVTLKQKVLNLAYLIMCIHLSAYISIQMFSFLTILAAPPVFKSNADILQSGLQPYLMPSTKYFINDEAYIAFADTAKDCESFLNCAEMSLKLNGVTVVIDSMFILLQAETAVNGEATTLRVHENLLTVFHEMLLRKNLPITKRFQEIILTLRETGVEYRIYDEALGLLTKSKSDSAAKNILSYSYNCGMGCSITLIQSAGVFYVWMFGSGLSFCVFVIEVMLKREHDSYLVRQ